VHVTLDPLGENYQTRTLTLDSDVYATLVRHRATGTARGAVLYVHGFSDYFFQGHVAEHFAAQGFDFYAVDMRGYGRSLRAGDAPNFVTDLNIHFEEIDAAVRTIRTDDGHQRLVLLGHSTGGLITSLWAHLHRDEDLIDALVLNSPWLELAEPWFLRTIGSAVIRGVGRVAPKLVIRPGLGPVYGHSIHRDHHGEWVFDVAWKPIDGFPVLAGWLRAVRRAHAGLQRGLDVRVPVLLLHASRSLLHAKKWSPAAMKADTVLDVKDMVRYAPKIGRNVDVVEVPDGMHDLFLSAEPARGYALSQVDKWLADQLPTT
jgi:alpha-beta hydrolase superfamily lysophospholipase